MKLKNDVFCSVKGGQLAAAGDDVRIVAIHGSVSIVEDQKKSRFACLNRNIEWPVITVGSHQVQTPWKPEFKPATDVQPLKPKKTPKPVEVKPKKTISKPVPGSQSPQTTLF